VTNKRKIEHGSALYSDLNRPLFRDQQVAKKPPTGTLLADVCRKTLVLDQLDAESR
jgi:hypothetical protein